MKDQYGRANAKAVKKLEKIAKFVEAAEEKYLPMSNEELQSQTAILKNRYANGETLDELLPDAYAVCREASKRVLKQRHYHVQVLGGIALHQGRIAQLATGEGKTLMETLPAYLNAIAGKVHIVTVNEYLAQRDKDWMGKVFRFLGLTVGITLSKMEQEEKQQAYNCDIVYGTSSEFGFDYLRDNMSKKRADCVQKGLDFALIDEVDSILIDEARTPLIISGPSGKSGQMYDLANRFACTLKNSANVDNEGKTESREIEPDGDYVVDQKQKSVRLTDQGVKKAQKFFKVDNLAGEDEGDNSQASELNYYINNALKAHAIMRRNDDYIVEKGQVIIVDSFTGRRMEGRRFSGGLHQAIEAKEHVTIKEENKTYATITLQNYFRMYRKMSGMTGTAKTEEEEFNTVYNIDVVAIPTNLPMIRTDYPDVFFGTRQAKMKALVEEIALRHKKMQPVLVGTTSVEKNQELFKLLLQKGIRANVLDASKSDDVKKLENEADIIAQAGQLGAITIATNMAGRGTDIILGGNFEYAAKRDLKIAGYSPEEINKVTEKLDLGKTDFTDRERRIAETYAQKCAEYKTEFDGKKKDVISLGGLCVIGTERHDARRIDNQLRGRAGRQGDPGCSVFFISAEDDLLRIFGGDRMKSILSFFGASDQPINLKLISKVIESSQKKVEGLHFSSRKHVLQYDDVNNKQRKSIYAERNRILDGGDIHEEILQMTNEYARHGLELVCHGELDVSKWDFDGIITLDDLTEYLQSSLNGFTKGKVNLQGETAESFLKNPFGDFKQVLKDDADVYSALLGKYCENNYGRTVKNLDPDEREELYADFDGKFEKEFDAWYDKFVSGKFVAFTNEFIARKDKSVNSIFKRYFGFDRLLDESDAESGEKAEQTLIAKTLAFVKRYDLNKDLDTLISLYVRNSLEVCLGGVFVMGPNFDVNKRIYKFFDFLQDGSNDVVINKNELYALNGETFRFQYQLALESKVKEHLANVTDLQSRIEKFAVKYVKFVMSDYVKTSVTKGNLNILNGEISPYFGFIQLLKPSDVVSARQFCDELAQKCKDKLNAEKAKVNAESAENEESPDTDKFAERERFTLLAYIDSLWMDHVDALDDLRQGVGLQAIGQHDPLMVYKKEAFEMFDKLNEMIAFYTVYRLLHKPEYRMSVKIKTDKSAEGDETADKKSAEKPVKNEQYKDSKLNQKLKVLEEQISALRAELDKLKPLYQPEELSVKLERLYKERYDCEFNGEKGEKYDGIVADIAFTERRLTAYNKCDLIVSELEKELDELANRQNKDEEEKDELEIAKALKDKASKAKDNLLVLRRNSRNSKK